ncbi:MAG TPA: DNA repair protein RecO [Thermomicrobiales bacterium]|nr:DNA repair protein RecO [Thermomicrobiales bacterium]
MGNLTERVYRSEAVVLRRLDFGEADRILTLYTPGSGKLRAVAKGVRKPASKLGGHLELFTRVKLLLARGRNLDVITGAETLDPYRGLREEGGDGDTLERLGAAFYLAELLDRFAEEGIENRAVWDLLTHDLRALSDGVDPVIATRHFELRLLGYLGYRPNLTTCASCDRPLEPIANAYSHDAGGVLCPDCRAHDPLAEPLSVNALKLLRLLERDAPAAVARLRIGPDVLAEVEGILRLSIRHIAERDLASPAVLRSLRG